MSAAAAAAAERAAYRSLLRLCRKVDMRPELMVPLLLSPQSAAHPMAEDALASACGNTLEFAHPSGNSRATARRHRRWIQELGLSYLPDAKELFSRISRAQQVAESVMAASSSAEVQPSKETKHDSKQESLGKDTARNLGIDWKPPRASTGDLPI